MSLQTNVTSVVQAIAADIKAIYGNQGSLSSLTTTQKSSLVAAINELKSAINGINTAIINDASTAGDTTHTWSTDKIIAQLAQVKSDIINGAPAAFDTLKEIADKLSSDDTALSGLLTAVGNRVAFDQAQTLTSPQQVQACSNIGVGDPTHDFVADYTAAKA